VTRLSRPAGIVLPSNKQYLFTFPIEANCVCKKIADRVIYAAAPCLLALLVGCATSGTEMQAECEARYAKFPDIFNCTHDAVMARNPGIMRDARAKLYLLRGEQLAGQVTTASSRVSMRKCRGSVSSLN
jgi:hypothetical protein